jgi:putative pyruvate formate lyase activating enzyme
MASEYPSYLSLLEGGELARRAREAVDRLADCAICGRQCHVDRLHEEKPKSYCRTGRLARVSTCFAHHGEEDCLRGWAGSGTIFFGHCNLRCVFCQNFELSWQGEGRELTALELARLMLRLQDQGCHNLNFVTPSHVVAQILQALLVAAQEGLRLPLVYNTGGYDCVETLRLLDGVIDIYMPDLKFWDPAVAKELANAEDYPQRAREAIKEMHRQVGDLVLDQHGIARRGVLVRHLVMPNGRAGTREVMRFLAREVSAATYVNVMAQYRPMGHAARHASINRPITLDEYAEALALATEEGITRLDRR